MENDKVIEAKAEVGIVKPVDISLRGSCVLEIGLEVKDEKGNITYKADEIGHSFLANFIKILYCTMMRHHAPYCDGSALTLVDTGGTSRAGQSASCQIIGSSSYVFNCNAASANELYGLWVGTDDGSILPKAIGNYALGAKITHGITSGKLSYGNHSVVNPVDDDSTYSYAGITRTFSNSSGGEITVKEIGLVSRMVWDVQYPSPETDYRKFLLIRDILASPVAVPNGQTLTASYRIKAFC